jgi:uncharacterized damage-inducible protein DinB
MNLSRLMANYADFNLWANQQYVNWLSPKTAEQLNQEVPSSFSSVLKTLNHIWAVEAYWYSIITGETNVENRYGATDLQAAEIFEGLVNRSTRLADAIRAFSESELAETIQVVSPWFEANQTRAEYIQHLFNHSTYHRGQVVTIARNAGLTDAPMTDFLFFGVMQAQPLS